MNNKKLKPGWRRVKFGDVVRLSKAKSKDPLSDGIERYVGLEHLDPGDLRIRSWGRVADGVTFTSVFQPGQVLFGKRRAYQRKVAVADFSGVCSGDIYVFETKDAQVLLPDLLPFICQSDAFFDHAVGTSAGSLSPRTNWTSLANYVFLLPPPEEQENIALLLASADEYIYQIQSTRSSLGNLERSAIQSILGNERDWQMTTMKSIVKRIEAGKSPKASSLPAESNEYGVLKVSAVGSQGYCSDENKALIDSDDFVVDATVQPGDFLVTRANAQSQGVARTCIVENTPSNLMLSDKTWRLNFEGDAPPKRFVLAWTKLPKFRSYIEALCSGTEAKNISQAKFLAGPMVVLSEKQQFDVDQLLCQTDLTRKVLEERERVSATMKRALLKKSLGEN
ncbi:restriction endonuclease subunit S [Aeromonas rivipollensis]|uniref:Restriction endonuclease subunit S n=1 Tax=Aeromonas rivipollensis TaxID=948519 RepID=A0AAW9Y9R5_9GAMM|nr:restriction endonuclease subunit S [Aeromonas rivipollensis]NEX75005.1 restriction endonuclease subunit S [Aeromonas rivipollensis]